MPGCFVVLLFFMNTVITGMLKTTLASECATCCQQGHACSKTLLQQNPSVLNLGDCRLMQVVLYNGRRMAVVVSYGEKIVWVFFYNL